MEMECIIPSEVSQKERDSTEVFLPNVGQKETQKVTNIEMQTSTDRDKMTLLEIVSEHYMHEKLSLKEM